MACTHSDTCPLHPHLNESLSAWRTHYCEHDTAWRECARYEQSLTGQPVPLALLPNGKLIGAMLGANKSQADTTESNASTPAATPAAGSPQAEATTTTTASNTPSDDEVEKILHEAKQAKPGLWQRFSSLFRGIT